MINKTAASVATRKAANSTKPGSYNLPPISAILQGFGLQPGRRGRSRCPIHGGSNPEAFSYDDSRSLWYCHRCSLGGDPIDLVRRVRDCSFPDALGYLGVASPSGTNFPYRHARKDLALVAVRTWCARTGRALRNEFFARQRIRHLAGLRLQADPADGLAWELLRIAAVGEVKNEFLLDQIDLCRRDEEGVGAWRKFRNAF